MLAKGRGPGLLYFNPSHLRKEWFMPLSTPLPLYAESDMYAVYHAVDPEAATAQIGVERWLLNNGLNYAKVALVKAPLNDVTRLTRNKGRVPWTENAAVVWYDDLQPDLRETRSGDGILARHGAWLVTLSSLHPIAYPSAVPLVTYYGHGFVVSSVSWSHNMASIASGDWDGGVRVWDANSARETLSYSHWQ